MRVLAFDPGIARVGYAIVDGDVSTQVMVECGLIETEAETPFPERLCRIHHDALDIADEFSPDLVAVEKLFFSKNTKTAMDVAHARGVLLMVPYHRNIPVFEYSPAEIKVAVTGSGSADKYQVGEMVKMLLKLQTVPKPDDVADAVALGLCHLFSVR
ncbi:MAG: crossover junction endodeoxyribonuclease RuvC [Caldisericia bacterium]